MDDRNQPGSGDAAPEIAAAPHVAHRALASPATVDRGARTVEVVWSPGVRARNLVGGLGVITEELEMTPAAVRMEALRSGRAPVLDTHRRGGARDVLGRVVAARLEGGRGYATLQFSTAADVEPVWQRIADGTLRSVSVGYRVHRYEQRTDAATAETIHRAMDWEPFEISVVPLPVDQAAAVRGEGDQGAPTTAIEPALIEDPIMPETTPEAAAPPVAASAAATQEPTPQNAAQPVAQPTRAASVDAATEAVRVERDRIAGLAPVASAARALVPAATVDALHQRAIAEGWEPEALRSALWEAMVKGAKPPSMPAAPAAAAPSNEDPAVLREAMAEALAARSMPGYQPQGDGRHVEFMGWRPSDMIGELLRAHGERNVPRNPTLLAERAFHTTSDFPLLLSAAVNKMLLVAYQPAQPTYRTIFLRRDFRDFKPHRNLRVGDFPNLARWRRTVRSRPAR